MMLPAIRGVIDRRMLVNFRVDPAVLAALLPAPFRPKVFAGSGVAGICLIRLRAIRPVGLPSWLGVGSENAAHRIAVEWTTAGGDVREGVYIPRRDTTSRLNAAFGGRLFPGIHHHARFEVSETAERFALSMQSDDGTAHLSVVTRLAADLPRGSIFGSVAEASRFFESGSLGYSPTAVPATYQGLELRCEQWHVEPLAVEQVASSFFDDRARFPTGSATFDCALLMRGIEHEWHQRRDMCCAPAVTAA